jgi:excisionase family DNA binding protein
MLKHRVCRLCGQPIPAQPELVSADYAAGFLGISSQMVRRQCAAGRLKAHRLGRAWLVERASVENYRKPGSAE